MGKRRRGVAGRGPAGRSWLTACDRVARFRRGARKAPSVDYRVVRAAPPRGYCVTKQRQRDHPKVRSNHGERYTCTTCEREPVKDGVCGAGRCRAGLPRPIARVPGGGSVKPRWRRRALRQRARSTAWLLISLFRTEVFARLLISLSRAAGAGRDGGGRADGRAARRSGGQSGAAAARCACGAPGTRAHAHGRRDKTGFLLAVLAAVRRLARGPRPKPRPARGSTRASCARRIPIARPDWVML